MSQVSIVDIEGNNPQIPTQFDADFGSAVPIANVLEILGDTVPAGIIPVFTTGSGNTITTNVQISQAIAASNALNIGLSAFNSAHFSVDANGFVSLLGGGQGIDQIHVDIASAPGTNPVVPTVAGQITVTGAQVASVGTNVIRTNSLAANTYTIEIQRSSSSAATDVSKNGVSHFSSTNFSLDANAFVTSNAITLTNGVNGVFSAGTTNLGGSISLRSDILTYVQPGAYPYTALSTDYYISVDSSAARTINLPNAPTTGKSYVIKDRVGSAAANNITITTPGGVVTIDGAVSKTIASNYGSVNVVFNGTSYEVW